MQQLGGVVAVKRGVDSEGPYIYTAQKNKNPIFVNLLQNRLSVTFCLNENRPWS